MNQHWHPHNSTARVRRFRKRQQVSKRDPVHFYPVPLPLSFVNKSIGEFKIIQEDRHMTDREWRNAIGEVLAKLLRNVVSSHQ
jgi:hypothetical protein